MSYRTADGQTFNTRDEANDHDLETLTAECNRLRALVAQGYDVVQDFMPGIRHFALQDYARLNTFLIEARKEKGR